MKELFCISEKKAYLCKEIAFRLNNNRKDINDFRSKHIGSDVLRYIKYWFLDPYNKTGCRYVLVDAYNSASTIRFYESNGFATVFSSEEQEKEYRHIAEERPLNTRLMYFDLMPLAKDNK